MNSTQVIQKLEARKAKAEELMSRELQSEKELERTSLYKEEMKYLITSIGYIRDKEIFIVSKSTLLQKSEEADFSSIEEDGYFYQLALLQSYPYKEVYLLWVESLSNL